MLRAGRAHRLCFSSLGSGSLCTGVHQDEDSRPLLDRPLGRRAGSEAPDPQLALPAGLAHQAPGALCEWGQAGRGAAPRSAHRGLELPLLEKGCESFG